MTPEGRAPALRILHVHTVPVVSGSGINTLLTMLGSLSRGHKVALACQNSGRLTEEASRAGIDIYEVPSMGREVRPLQDVISVFALRRLMRDRQFDVVHTHNSKAGFVGRLAARLAGVPVVVHTIHGFAFHDAESSGRRWLFRVFEHVAAGWSDGMIFISHALEQWAGKEGIGKGIPRRVIYSGIDVGAFGSADGSAVREEFKIDSGRTVVGIVSKLWEGKGHHVLFRAWRTIQKNWKGSDSPLLLVVGEGPLDLELKKLAGELGIRSNVVFTGFRRDIPAITSAMDISVLPSAFEGMGRVILEAMAAGKPVVASRVGGIPDLVREGVNGLLVPPNDEEALCGALVRLLTDERQRQDLGSGARRSIEQKHSSEAMVNEIHDFYAVLMSGKFPGRQL